MKRNRSEFREGGKGWIAAAGGRGAGYRRFSWGTGVLFAAALLCFGPGAGPAQGERVENGTLDEAAAEELALENSPAVRAAEAAVEAARARGRVLTAWRDPEVRGSYGRQRNVGNDAGGVRRTETLDEYGGLLRVFPMSPWVRRSRRRSGDARVHVAESNAAAVRRGVRMEVRGQYDLLVYYDALRPVLEGMLGNAARRREAAYQRRSAGEGGALDLVDAQRRYLERRHDLQDLLRRSEIARRRLAQLTGVALEKVCVTGGGTAPREPPAYMRDCRRLEEIAVSRRPEAAAASWELAAAEAELQAGRRERLPWPSHVQASYRDREGDGGESWTLQMAFPLPLASSSAAEVKLLERNVAVLRERLVAVRRRIRNEVQQAFAEAVAAFAEARREELSWNEVRRSCREIREGAGQVPVDVRLRLKEEELAAERALLEAQYACRRALRGLEAAVGIDFMRPASPAVPEPGGGRATPVDEGGGSIAAE